MKKIILGMAILIASTQGNAGNWSLGAGGLISANPYISMKTNIIPIPFISFQGQYVSVYGTMAKARYVINKENTLGLMTKLGMQTFDPEDVTDTNLKLLSKRERLVYMGPYYRFRNTYGQLTAHSILDVTGRSNGGYEIGANYSYPLHLKNNKIYLRPSIGAVWHNKKLGDHFYQVSANESIQSGLQAYQPGSYIQPSAGIFAGVNLGKKFYWTNVAKVNYVPNRIYNSPMVKNSRVNYSLITGITYEIGDSKSRFNH
tara:strand:- start:181 stop:954 length:774 start_codon:yes stop_codon:yes gene_type:complete